MSASNRPRYARREMIRMIAAVAAAPVWLPGCATAPDSAVPAEGQAGGLAGIAPGYRGPAGTLSDPDLVDPTVPWPLTLSEEEQVTLAALCDLIIPADERSPAASALGAHDFIDEWISAPYEQMQNDREQIRGGLTWLDDDAQRRFQAPFADLAAEQQRAICDDICHAPEAQPEFESAAHFFDKTRMLTAMAFYTTQAGMDDVGYVGNTPQSEWLPPPSEVLRQVGLE